MPKKINYEKRAKELKALGVFKSTARKNFTKSEKSALTRLYNIFKQAVNSPDSFHAIKIPKSENALMRKRNIPRGAGHILVRTANKPDSKPRYNKKSGSVTYTVTDGNVIKKSRIDFKRTIDSVKQNQNIKIVIHGRETTVQFFDASEFQQYVTERFNDLLKANVQYSTESVIVTRTKKRPNAKKSTKKISFKTKKTNSSNRRHRL
jgi:hypothetical protein